MDDYTIQPTDIEKYTIPVNVTEGWVCSRNPQYQINAASLQPGRFNLSGEAAFYIASGSMTMQAEVPKWQDRVTYPCSSSLIHAFDLAAWSEDNGCRDAFLKSKEENGHGICQEISAQLRDKYGLSGIRYNSERMHASGLTGSCLVIFPASGSIIDDTFFVKDYTGQK